MAQMLTRLARRAAELNGEVTTHLGSYKMAVTTGAVTTIAAGTASAGHMFAFRWVSSASKCVLRHVSGQFTLTTAFGAAQEVGCDLITTRTYSASHSGGTAIDMGGTVTNANKIRAGAPTSLMSTGDARISTTGALTNGTHTIDPNPLAAISGYAGAVGIIVSRYPSGSLPGGLLWEARDDQDPLVLTTNEGFLLRNTILMGASGVGRWQFHIEWDEVTV
jgi:hypothetical protein